MRLNIDKFLVLCGMLGALTILIIDIVLPSFYTGYDRITDVISMLGAADSPVAIFANAGLCIFGSFIVLFGIGMYRNYSEDWTGNLASLLIIVAGIGSFLIGVFHCDPGCINTSFTGQMHGIVTMIPFAVAPFMMMFLMIHELRGKGFKGHGNNHLLYMVFMIIVADLIFGYLYFGLNIYVGFEGLYERIGIIVPIPSIIVLSAFLYRENSIRPGTDTRIKPKY